MTYSKRPTYSGEAQTYLDDSETDGGPSKSKRIIISGCFCEVLRSTL